MKVVLFLLIAGCIAIASCHSSGSNDASASDSVKGTDSASAALPPRNPEKNCYFGSTHTHSTMSFDAYNFGCRTTPDQTYDFDAGGEIEYLGVKMQRKQGLDFTCLTDHAEYLGVNQLLIDTTNPLSKSPVGLLVNAGNTDSAFKAYSLMGLSMIHQTPIDYLVDPKVVAKNWKYEIDIANKHYKPGKYTTIHSYEWTAAPGFANMHRNVFFRGDKVPDVIYSALNSNKPEDLWNWMETQRKTGIDVFAISHNGNISNGLMYPMKDTYGNPLDMAYAERRITNEPLAELMQTKGTSETHPELSPNDEFANYELYVNLLYPGKAVPSKISGGYIREALGHGLELSQSMGGNPYKMGVVGGTDMHSGINATEEYNFPGSHAGGDNTAKKRLYDNNGVGTDVIKEAAAALTGVWAEENTREAIFDAMKRKEVFCTSGQLMRIRLFGGWDFDANTMKSDAWVKTAYARGVPMGGDLPVAGSAKAPTFIMQAIKDPNSGNLDRIQVIKVSLKNGKYFEKIYNVAWSGDRKPDASGKLPPVGNTVDVKNASYTNTIGSAELSAFWRDPDFDASVPSCYYIRVLEIPVPRWSTYDAKSLGVEVPKGNPTSIQERAWSSAIWYTPKKS
ncbi:MAG TPA: DUF3604 domain-containing protein [Puia sp.]|nr:DUF3604 domain-containing protein [Puia sp.]